MTLNNICNGNNHSCNSRYVALLGLLLGHGDSLSKS